MQLTILTATLVGAVSALPRLEPRNGNATTPFSLLVLAEGQPWHMTTMNAFNNSFVIGLQDNFANCTTAPAPGPPAQSAAYFELLGDKMLLHSQPFPFKTPMVYVDRSGMGQGNIQYSYYDGPGPRNAEYSGWALPTDPAQPQLINFKGETGWIACPPDPAGIAQGLNFWEVWVNAGVANPGHSSGCVPFTAQVQVQPDAPQCQYVDIQLQMLQQNNPGLQVPSNAGVPPPPLPLVIPASPPPPPANTNANANPAPPPPPPANANPAAQP